MRTANPVIRRPLGLLVALCVAGGGCAPPPRTGPSLAVERGRGAQSDPARDDDAATGWSTPQKDLAWQPCGDLSAPTGTTVQCADFPSTVEHGGVTVSIPAVRIIADVTPDDAAPLVVTAGAGAPATDVAVRFAGDAGAILDAHPVVVVGHRGIGTRADDCLSARSRATLDALAQDGTDPQAPSSRGELAEATVECLDQLEGMELAFGSSGAARDLVALRQEWGVSSLAVLGIGQGALAATRYAAENPDSTAALLLDSPAPLDGEQESSTRAFLDGAEAALHQWALSCHRRECGSADPSQRVDRIRRALDEAGRPGAPVPRALLSDVLRRALADISGASEGDASEGDRILGALTGFADGTAPRSVRERAEELRGSSLPWVARCDDLPVRVPLSRVDELDAEWSEAGPTFGATLAAQLPQCSSWPVPTDDAPRLSPGVPVLVSAGAADPIAGVAGAEALADGLAARGAERVVTVTWHSPGSRALWHSRCAAEAAVAFLDDPTDARDETFCPS